MCIFLRLLPGRGQKESSKEDECLRAQNVSSKRVIENEFKSSNDKV